MYLLDTNILSEVLRKKPNPNLTKNLKHITVSTAFSSVISLFEIRFGVMLRQNDTNIFWNRIESSIIPLVQWLDLNSSIAKRAGDIAALLQAHGNFIGINDCLIAATALEHNFVLVTRNTVHFQRIGKLAIENWFL